MGGGSYGFGDPESRRLHGVVTRKVFIGDGSVVWERRSSPRVTL